jgi:FKBP-type peptidyl-prolyl cis-trans isomerase
LVSDLDGNVLFTNSKPLDVEFGKPFDTKGFMLGLGMMREGGKAKLIVPSKIGVGMYGTQGVDGFTTLKYEVELLDISSYSTIVKQKEAEARKRNANRKKISKEEQDRLTVYLNQNVIKEKPLASGMYYIESEKGTGTAVRYGSKLQVHYKLFNLDGKLIDSSIESGQAFSIEMGKGQVIEGWEIGLKKMNVGTTATFIIPSNLAYGKEGLGKIIPPNSTLIFDVLLVSVD